MVVLASKTISVSTLVSGRVLTVGGAPLAVNGAVLWIN